MKKSWRKKICFFLGPFSPRFIEYYADVFRPAVAAAGFEPLRADEIYGARPFIEDIMDSIKRATVVVAEVTGRNSNVMYEMGIAYAWKKPIVIVSQSMADVPSDLKHHRILLYRTAEPDWPEKLRSKITRTVQEAASRAT